MNSKQGKGIIEAAIWKGVEPCSRSKTFFTMASSYLETSTRITSFLRSFRSDSLNRLKSAMRASREGGDGVSIEGGVGADEVEALPLPLFVVGRAWGGRVVEPSIITIPPLKGGRGRSFSGPRRRIGEGVVGRLVASLGCVVLGGGGGGICVCP